MKLQSYQEAMNVQSSLKMTILQHKNLPNWLLVDFYILACSSHIFQPILDFLGSTDSCDPKDFKTGLKKAIEGHMKVVQKAKRSASNQSTPVICKASHLSMPSRKIGFSYNIFKILCEWSFSPSKRKKRHSFQVQHKEKQLIWQYREGENKKKRNG